MQTDFPKSQDRSILVALAGTIALLVGLASAAAILAIFIGLDGVVIRDLWGWFAVPALSVPAMSFKGAAGLCVLWNAFSYKASTKKYTTDEAWFAFRTHIISMCLLWVIGYMVYHYV